MKRLFLLSVIASMFIPVLASDVSVPNVESVRYFTRPDMSHFQYSLPEHKNFLKRKSQEVKTDDISEITLDEDDIKPVKKVIKKLNVSEGEQTYNQQNTSDTPMNYDSFPKFYDANDLMNQQFIPTATF